jgi:hypothetical protein
MTEATTITVLYERKLSDGNYGSEGLSMASTVTIGQDNWRIDELLVLARQLREAVLGQLAQSTAVMVARVAAGELQPPARRDAVPEQDLEDLPF